MPSQERHDTSEFGVLVHSAEGTSGKCLFRGACSHVRDLCNSVCDLQSGRHAVLSQERPVTKEVVTYVQERRPIAKQVLLL